MGTFALAVWIEWLQRTMCGFFSGTYWNGGGLEQVQQALEIRFVSRVAIVQMLIEHVELFGQLRRIE